MNVPIQSPLQPISHIPLTFEQLCLQIDQMARTLKQNVTALARDGSSFDRVEQKVRPTVFTIGKQAWIGGCCALLYS